MIKIALIEALDTGRQKQVVQGYCRQKKNKGIVP
jgi:hypothetical protein